MSLALQSFPLLISATSRMPLEWNHGPMYEVLLTSRYVRISELGIQWCVLCGPVALNMSAFPPLKLFSGMHGWSSSLPCAPAQNALCRATGEADSAITLFPTLRVDVPLAHNVFVEGMHMCDSHTANRHIADINTGYQVSLCDLIDSKLDFVLDVDSAIVYWRQNDKPLWWSLCVTLTSLFFFTRVCEHLALLVRGQRRRFSSFTTAAIISMLLLCRLLLATGVLSQHLVTSEEITLNLILELYCYVYILAEFTASVDFAKGYRRLCTLCYPSKRTIRTINDSYRPVPSHDTERQEIQGLCDSDTNKGKDDISTLGSLLAVQLILTAQLQNTFENPFLGILTLLFGTRAFLKFMNFMLLHTTCKRTSAQSWTIACKLFFLCVDTITLACVFELAVRTSARSQAEYSSTATGMLIIIVLGGGFLHSVITPS